MIIVSQDKKEIINFEGITRISIIPPVEEGYKYSIATNGCLDLGYYKTEERAKEVLQEIVDTFIGIRAIENIEKDLTFDENTQIRIRPKVYYIPKA